MKFGSVKFFKRLIVTGFILVVVVPALLAVVFGVLFVRQRQRADWLETLNWALLNSTELPVALNDAEQLGQYLQNPPPDFQIGPTFPYQKAYPNLYTNRPETRPPEGKVCYLTFDDGPSLVTQQNLKTLADYGIQATFFVTGQNSEDNPDILAAAAAAGHTVAVHSYSHAYADIYAGPEAFLADFERMYDTIYNITGTRSGIFRFAGGSINVYNSLVYSDIVAEMTRRGFVFYDWNCAASDAVAGGASRADILQNVLNSAAGQDTLVVLMHDRADNVNTAAALPDIIENLAAQGYRFEALSAEVPPVTYYYEP